MRKAVLWLILGGMVYFTIEGVWRIPSNGGWANIAMLLIGGVCFFLIGNINQFPKFYKLSMRLQSLIGAAVILLMEFISGCIFNLWLGLEIWDYSDMPLNVCGQICLLYGILWFFLVPFAIWLEDKLNLVWERAHGRDSIYDYTLIQAYKELFIFR